MDRIIGEKKIKNSNELINLLNSNNEYQSQGYMYKRGMSNKNLPSSSKVKRISTKYLREKNNSNVFSKIQNANNNNRNEVSDHSSKPVISSHKFQEILLSQNQIKRSKLLTSKNVKRSTNLNTRLA